MPGPTHRRLVLIGLVLVAAGSLWLIDRQRTPPPKPVSAATTISTRQEVLTEIGTVESPVITATAPHEVPPTSSTIQHGFRGRVIDAVTRRPVTAFDVQLIRVRRDAHAEEPPITRNFKTATGQFTWTDIAEGEWRAAVSAPGYQMFNVADVQISANEISREIVMPLLRGFAVRGRIVELSTGAGLAGASIGVRQVDGRDRFDRSKPSATSNQDGSFTLDGLPRGDIVLTVSARDHAYRALRIVVDETTPPQEIALSAGATITGIVVTSAGLPVNGRIVLEASGTGYMHETDGAGQFSFNHMPPGQYRVSADTSAGSASHEFMLGQDEIKQDITLIVGEGRSVRGTLRDAGGQTERLQRARIMLTSQSSAVFTARPDERRAYSFNGVPPGRAVITVFTDELQFEKPVDVPADRDVTVDLVIPTGARLSGRVTRGGKPAAHRTIWMSPADRKSHMFYRVQTSEDGHYEIAGLPAGDYRLRAEEDITRTIAIAGDAVLNIDIPMVQLSARVLEDGAAVPIVGANVYVRGNAPETARVGVDKQTDDFGQVTLTGIESGEIVLMVYKPGYELHRETIAYSSPIKDKTIRLRKSDGVEVRVQPGSRRFPRGFTLTQSFPGNDQVVDLWMPIDREGVCHVPGALAGTTFQIGRFSGEPIVIEAWDGQPFELP